ncbi:MAG: hypothetical protein WBW28_00090 [Pseudolabrys sp.]
MLPRASAALAACLKRLDRLGLAISRQSLVARRISALIVDGTQRKLVRRKDVDELVDHICGTVLTHLSGMGARCSRDMVVRRSIDAVVLQVRSELAQVCEQMADRHGEPPLGAA